jgi:hypothetical protein
LLIALGCSTSPRAPLDAIASTDAISERGDASPDTMDTPSPPRVHLVVARESDRDTRFVTREHMIASIEMQHSGEPLAEAMGRDLAGFDRFMLPTDRYTDPADDAGVSVIDLVGFSTAVESYEYSKMPMNTLAFESTAGTSLAHAPLVNPSGVTGERAMRLLRDRVQHYAIASRAGIPPAPGSDAGATLSGFVTVPAPEDNELNRLGFGGFWPTVHPFIAFDPTCAPSRGATRNCSLEGGYGASAGMAQLVGDYECGYSTLHLTTSRNDTLSIERAISPGASGWAAWKYALWVINYLQILHDTDGAVIESVPERELSRVGQPGNRVRGMLQGGGQGAEGTWLGSNDIEGFQAAFLIESVDAQAHQWITALTTADGATLGGFATVREALAYDYQTPLRWFPARIDYDEERDATYGYHRPVRYRVGRADSNLLDLVGILGGFAEQFALTDRTNRDVGGSQTTRVYFDGDPFADDNQTPDGEDTPHDRALAVVKLALVDLDRLHRDPATGVLVDTVTFTGMNPTRAATASAVGAAQAIVALRTARRALSGNLTLYSNSTPDTAVARTALDGTSMRGAPEGGTVAQRLTALLRAEADLLLERLSTEEGRVFPAWDLTARRPTAMEGDLEAYSACIRGLLEATLATGDTRYQRRAERVYQRMESVFYSASLRAWRSTAAPDAPLEFTPLRFGLLQSALRETYKLIASAPGREAFARTLEGHLARLHKLVLNGWDDRDEDELVDWPEECVSVVAGIPRGGLQLGERALTGETGVVEGMIAVDRDRDCVPEIGAVNLPATLAARIRFTPRTP